jgi:elongation factor Ts
MTAISASDVAELRRQTGAGLVDCKQALVETNGNLEEATTWLKKKGVSNASKKALRTTREGVVQSYLHFGGKLGVLVEVNCETDFVARNEEFRNFVNDLCLQIAAAGPTFVRREEVSEEVIRNEREIAEAQCAGKPSSAVAKIVEGKLNKWFSEICLMEQPFVKNPDKTVRDLVNEQVTKTGENIVVRRFVRYQLGG